MCGLGGIFSYRGEVLPVERDELIRMRDRMEARGPDGVGLWVSEDRRVGLTHRRLAILDLTEAGAQPMATPDGRLRVVFNGEIYNYPELRVELESRGCAFVSRSDTEVLLHLYRLYGREMIHHLRGMFAFALWDEDRRGLMLARDHLGIKPLYYADDGALLRVASQVKALLAGNSIETSPDPAGHAGFFLWGYVPEPYTLYRNVRAVPAGASLWVQQDMPSESPRPYFNLGETLREAEAEAMQTSPAESAHRFQTALRDSVRHHMLADVPVGVFLSSGLDSTSIAALSAEHSATPLRAITLGFEEFRETPNDEIPLAESMAREFGFAHTTRWLGRDEFAADREAILTAMDQPSIDGVNTYFVSKAAREAGLKVALSGLGGDELLAGYSSFDEIPRLVRAVARFRFLGKAFRVIPSRMISRFTSPKYVGLFEYGGTLGGAYLLRRSLYMPWELPRVLGVDLAQEGWRELKTLVRLEETIDGISSPRLRVSALETAWYMRNQLLRDADWASMAHSVEVRVPLADVRLIRDAASLSAGNSPPTKWAMASAPARQLPKAVLNRPKTGFSIPVQSWLMGEGTNPGRGLRGWAELVYRHFVSE